MKLLPFLHYVTVNTITHAFEKYWENIQLTYNMDISKNLAHHPIRTFTMNHHRCNSNPTQHKEELPSKKSVKVNDTSCTPHTEGQHRHGAHPEGGPRPQSHFESQQNNKENPTGIRTKSQNIKTGECKNPSSNYASILYFQNYT